MRKTRLNKRLALSLAVRYNAFREACDRENSPDRDNALACWGDCLLHTQRETGVECVPNDILESTVDYARKRIARRDVEASLDAPMTLIPAYAPHDRMD